MGRDRTGFVVAIALSSAFAFGFAGTPAGAAPAPVQGTLNSVSCTATTACVAVGSYVNAGNTVTLAERWNGTAWTKQATPNPAGGTEIALNGVSCTSVTNCLAVGSYFDDSGIAPLAELWNGTKWTIKTVPLPTGGRGGGFNGVSCVAAKCTAVGFFADSANQNEALAESWNGSTFTAQSVSAPAGATTNTLNAVSCSPAPSVHCEAVGWYYHDGFFISTTLAEGWDGTAWSLQTAPVPPNAEGGSVPTGISCTAPRACTAVGNAFNGGDAPVPGWAQRWNGTAWSNQNLRSPKTAIFSQPAAVSCSTPGPPCTAVGRYANGSTFLSFAAGRTGTRWKPEKTPQPKDSTGSALGGVSCVSPTACTAVGNASNAGNVPLTLAELWNGTKWTIQKTPVP
jgi:hypothetical protein